MFKFFKNPYREIERLKKERDHLLKQSQAHLEGCNIWKSKYEQATSRIHDLQITVDKYKSALDSLQPTLTESQKTTLLYNLTGYVVYSPAKNKNKKSKSKTKWQKEKHQNE